jgi:hypothetical protein
MAILTPMPRMQFFDANGNPLAGGKVLTFVTATSTPKATFTDQGGLTPNANPVILDSEGRADIWLATDELYRVRVDNANDVTQWGPIDGVGDTGDVTQGVAQPPNTIVVNAIPGELVIPIAGLAPAGSLLKSVTMRIVTSFGTSNGLTLVNLGDSEIEDRWGANLSIVSPTTSGAENFNAYAGGLPLDTSYNGQLIAVAGTFDSVGTANITAHYDTYTPAA